MTRDVFLVELDALALPLGDVTLVFKPVGLRLPMESPAPTPSTVSQLPLLVCPTVS